LVGGRTPRAIVARSFSNRFADEPVLISLTVFENPIAFANGALIAEGKIDGRLTDSELYAQVREFFQVSVNAKARQAKMIPVYSKDGETFGEISAQQFLNALDEIKQIKRIMRIQAVARTDIRAAGPLTFEIVLK
jgi:hypothetical protein